MLLLKLFSYTAFNSMSRQFCRQTGAISDAISFTKHSPTSNPQLKTKIASYFSSNKRETNASNTSTACIEKVPIGYDFSISEAPNQTNQKLKTRI